MPSDVTPEAVADLQRLRDAASPLPWFYNSYSAVLSDPREKAAEAEDSEDIPPAVAFVPKRSRGDEPTPQGSKDAYYITAACNIAPDLADAWERAVADLRERDAEIARLKEALQPFADYSDPNCRREPTMGDCHRAADALKGAHDG